MAAPVRGRISVPDRGYGTDLMFNPTETKDNKEVSWATKKVPGASHPVYQYGSGGERLISFQLYLNGITGKMLRNLQGADNSSSIAPEIRFYQSLLYPHNYGLGEISAVNPPIVLYTYGVLYQGLACICKKADVTVTMYSRDLDPMKATIDIALAEAPDQSVSANQVYSEDFLKDVEFQGEKLRRRRGELF